MKMGDVLYTVTVASVALTVFLSVKLKKPEVLDVRRLFRSC